MPSHSILKGVLVNEAGGAVLGVPCETGCEVHNIKMVFKMVWDTGLVMLALRERERKPKSVPTTLYSERGTHL